MRVDSVRAPAQRGGCLQKDIIADLTSIAQATEARSSLTSEYLQSDRNGAPLKCNNLLAVARGVRIDMYWPLMGLRRENATIATCAHF